MKQNMIGFSQEYYTLQNADGHDLFIRQGINSFLTEDIAVEIAEVVCKESKDTVLVRKHVDTVVRAFQAVITTSEVADTSKTADVAS